MKKLAYRTISKLMRTISVRSYRPRLSRALASMVVLGVLFGVALSSDARAAEFNAVIENLNNVQHPTAQIDVSLDTGSGTGLDIVFLVFRPSDGQMLSSFVVQTNENGFCSYVVCGGPERQSLHGVGRITCTRQGHNSSQLADFDRSGAPGSGGIQDRLWCAPSQAVDWRPTRGGAAHDHSSRGPWEGDVPAHRQRLVITGRSECFRRESWCGYSCTRTHNSR